LKVLIVPYFISGLYLGWGTHDNTIKYDSSNKANSGGGLVVDTGNIINPVQSPVQSLNPFNDPKSGNDNGTVPLESAFDPGASTKAGDGNVLCGNSFVSFSGVSNPNVRC
jgi:hypothetical protein